MNNINRRRFLQSAFYSSLLYGAGSLPNVVSNTGAMPQPLNSRVLANLYLNGGPDMRHLIVPAFDATPNSYGNEYWKNRYRSHQLTSNQSTWQARWENDYYPITVGGQNWNGGLVDSNGLNNQVTFGIWREAGWLIDMFRAGNVALIFNAVGGTNRAHDLSTLMLEQGNLFSTLSQSTRSGWGGRLARSAGGNSVSLISSPRPFTFGPVGAAPNYNPNAIDNIDLLSVENAREIGLYDFDIENSQLGNRDETMARAAKSYYAGLRQERIARVYTKFLDHESTIRQFGEAIQERLGSVPTPLLISALRNQEAGINLDPNDNDPRRVLRSTGFARQISNLYDLLVSSDLVPASVMSMEYGGWDSHGDQRRGVSASTADPNNPNISRGIENGLKDIFGGQFGSNPSDSAALHSGFSALWASLPSATDRQKIVLTIAGEFGRQIRDNGDAGTDHGKGNLMFVIGEQCRGGVYGQIFPNEEIERYQDLSQRTPDIDPRTDIDTFYAQVCNFIQPGSGSVVFPRTANGFSGEAPRIERVGMFNNLFS